MKEMQIEYTPKNMTAICGLPASMIVTNVDKIIESLRELRDEASKPDMEAEKR